MSTCGVPFTARKSILKLSPIGVFALICPVVAANGPSVLLPLLKVILVAYAAYVAHMVLTYSLAVKGFAGLSPLRFFRAMSEPMLFAFSSASSVGTLPFNMDATQQLGARKEVSSFVLPLGATINMDGTAIYQGVCAIFIAQIFGIELTIAQQLTIILTATLASIGTAGVPGSGMIMLTMGMKISILYLGKMEFPKFRLVDWKDEGAMVQSPAVAILIQHPTLGNILYDTGNCEDFSAVYTEEMLHDYPITEMISIQEALAQKGLTPDDIDLIILSHLHFDHAGGLKHFVGTKAIRRVLVSEADLKNAYWSVMTGNGGAYIRSLFDVEGIQFQTIRETTKLAEDLELFIQASHTPGVIGMVLKTDHHGTILTTSDTIYTAESYEKELPPGGTINKTTDEFFDNLKRIKEMEKAYHATLLFGHDYDQIMDWVAKGVID